VDVQAIAELDTGVACGAVERQPSAAEQRSTKRINAKEKS